MQIKRFVEAIKNPIAIQRIEQGNPASWLF